MNYKNKYEKYLPVSVRPQSRWATEEEIISSTGVKRIDLNQQYSVSGVPLISDGKTVYADTSDAHTIIYGSSGSMKTRLFIFESVLSLIMAGESVIVTDPKGEIFDRSAGTAEKEGYKVYALDFRSMDKSHWSPLAEPYRLYKTGKKDEGIAMLNDFIDTLAAVPIVGDPFWDSTARSLALSTLLVLFEAAADETEVTLENWSNIASSFGSEDTEKYLKYIQEHIPKNSICSMNLRSLLNAAEKTKQSIQVSLYSYTSQFITNARLLRMLEYSDFRLESLSRRKFALFIIIPDENNTYGPIIANFIKQAYQTLISVAQKSETRRLPIRINFILDEFANIGKIPFFSAMMAAGRSRNIRFTLVIQTNINFYGDERDIITGNASTWIFLHSRDLCLLREISELCGIGNDGLPLISISHLQRLNKDKGEALILHNRNYPYISRMPDIDAYEFDYYPAPDIHSNAKNKTKFMTIQDIIERHEDNFTNWFKN